MVEHALNVLSVIELRQWLWFGVIVMILLVSDHLYNLLICPIVGGQKISPPVFSKALLIYTGFILLATLFCRESMMQSIAAPFPLWSWVEVFQKKDVGMLYDILLNILLFVPFGGLLKMAFKKIRLWVGWLVGFLFSMMIEVFQLVFHLGLFEWDDMLHNSLGCLIGCAAVWAVRAIRTRISQKSC